MIFGCLGLDPSGYFTNNTAIYHGYEFEEFVYQAFPTYNGGFVAIGQTKSSGMPDSDAYIVEIGPEGNIVADPSLVLEGENRFVGIYKYPWSDDDIILGLWKHFPVNFALKCSNTILCYGIKRRGILSRITCQCLLMVGLFRW